MSENAPRVALIGFGEAGSAFAREGVWGGHARGWDIAADRRAAMAECGVVAAKDGSAALAGVDIVLSLVTADAALSVARDYGAGIKEGAIWCDLNSVAPGTKIQAAELIEEAGGRYVDVAVMSPVNPAALDVPLLLAGPAADDARFLLGELGFTNTRTVGWEVGRASAIKMIRSVMVKGLEALTSECAAAAEAAGVMDEVMASLDASERDWGWAKRTEYNRERMATHGLRRAAEMEEVAKTLRALGIEPVMSEGTVILQRDAGKSARGEGEK